MIPRKWGQADQRMLVCVDSYKDGVLRGRYFNSHKGVEQFESLSQFIVRMEASLNELQSPQPSTVPGSFHAAHRPEETPVLSQHRQGTKATFGLRVLFRQHTSWQGIVVWLEKNIEYRFRSVLELVMLLDNALKCEDDAAVIDN